MKKFDTSFFIVLFNISNSVIRDLWQITLLLFIRRKINDYGEECFLKIKIRSSSLCKDTLDYFGHIDKVTATGNRLFSNFKYIFYSAMKYFCNIPS